MSKIKLSYIVPVYNVDNYLRKCVDSLLAQNYESYEIILVDDGSTDGSGAICDEYASKHQTSHIKHQTCPIRVIHQENAGLSAARNTGIMAARGTYLCFVDSDDYWLPNVLGELMAQVERENLDVLRFDYQNVNERYEVFEPNKTLRYIDQNTEIVDGISYLNTRMGYACYAVMYIMRKTIVPTFTTGLHFEDVDWLPRMMLQPKRVNSTTAIAYNYLLRQGSITQVQENIDKIKKNLEDRLFILKRYQLYQRQYPKCVWLRNMQSNMGVGVLTSISQYFYSECNEYIERIAKLDVFPLSIANQGKTFERRAKIINLFGPKLYCFIMHLRSKM